MCDYKIKPWMETLLVANFPQIVSLFPRETMNIPEYKCQICKKFQYSKLSSTRFLSFYSLLTAILFLTRKYSIKFSTNAINYNISLLMIQNYQSFFKISTLTNLFIILVA